MPEKIAVCMCGHPRSVLKTYKNFPLLSHDLFIHTSEEFPQEVIDFLKPKKYIIEKQFPFLELEEKMKEVYFMPSILNNYLQQIHSWKRCFSLVSGYDYIIKTRPDVWHKEKLNFDLEKLNMFPRKVDIKREQCYTDIVFFGKSEYVKKVGDLIDWMMEKEFKIESKWTRRLPPENAAVVDGKHSPESILATYLEDSKLPVCYTKDSFEEVMEIVRN